MDVDPGLPKSATDALARRLERESGKKLADYPFDPKARSELLGGLEKLRAVPSPMREQLWALYWLAEAREENGEAEAQRHEEKAKTERAELVALESLAEACMTGRRGAEAQEIARMFLLDPGGRRRTDRASLTAVRDELRRLRRRGAA